MPGPLLHATEHDFDLRISKSLRHREIQRLEGQIPIGLDVQSPRNRLKVCQPETTQRSVEEALVPRACRHPVPERLTLLWAHFNSEARDRTAAFIEDLAVQGFLLLQDYAQLTRSFPQVIEPGPPKDDSTFACAPFGARPQRRHVVSAPFDQETSGPVRNGRLKSRVPAHRNERHVHRRLGGASDFDPGIHRTVAVRPYEVRVPYGVVGTDGVIVTGIEEKPVTRHFISAGIYLLDSKLCRDMPTGQSYEMPDLINRLVAEGRRVVSFPIREYWLDIGQTADYQRALTNVGKEEV